MVFAVIFLISGGLLLDYYLDNQKAADDFNQIAHIVEQVKTTKPTVSPGETEPEVVLTEVQHPETGETVMVLPEYAEIFTMNPDTVGWISIADTRVNLFPSYGFNVDGFFVCLIGVRARSYNGSGE